MTTQDRILDRAVRVFSRKGYKNSCIEEIARKAAVNKLTVFRHFHDKETLFLQAVNRMQKTQFDPQALDRQLTFRDIAADLQVIGDAYLKEINASLPLIRIYIGDGLNIESLKDERWFVSPSLKDHFQSYVERTPGADALAKEHAALLAEMFVSYITRKVMPSNKAGDTPAAEETLREGIAAQANYMAHLILGT